MARSRSPTASSVASEAETENSFSDTEAFAHRSGRGARADGPTDRDEENGWELEYIQDTKIITSEDDAKVERVYQLKFKGYEEAEWQPENNVDGLELVRCYWENVLRGNDACVKAQQELLVEIANRPDSDQENAPHLDGNSNTSSKPPNHPRKKPFKHTKQLKPRKDNDSDIAESDSSDSSSPEDQESDDEPLKITFPPSLYPDFFAHNQDGNSDLTCLKDFEWTGKPRTPKLREQMKSVLYDAKKITTLDSACPGPLFDQADILEAFTYRHKNAETAEQIGKFVEEINLGALHIGEKQQATRVNASQPGPRLKLRMPKRDEGGVPAQVEGDIPVGRMAQDGEDERMTAEDRRSKGDKKGKTTMDAAAGQFADENGTGSRSLRPVKRLGTPLVVVPRNSYHRRLSTCTPPSPHQHHHQQQQPSPDPDDSLTGHHQSIFHPHNPRIKRKFSEPHNMKFSSFNQNKKLCLRKKTLRWADQLT